MKANRQQRGVVFNIQKYSVNDGPGIRTVVFLKGCPLRCKWCSNPESQLSRRQVLWDRKKCLHCGICLHSCPEAAVSGPDPVRIDHAKCTGCGVCVDRCSGMALKMEGETKTVEQVLKTVLQDMPFYEESGGGLTVSGGEMLTQPDFSRELLLAAKEEGLHTCCETTGFAAPDVFKRVTEPLDLLLFDMKHWDPEKHMEGTGVSNELPLANMRSAAASGKKVLPRIPVIPGFNDSEEDARRFSLILRESGVSRCQLLPFHQFGENKYDLLNLDYSYRSAPALHREDLESYLHVFHENQIEAFF